MKKGEIKAIVKKAHKQRDAVLLTRTGGTAKTERFIVTVTNDSFTHTDAVGKNINTVTTPFGEVMTISLIEGEYSVLSKFKKQFDFSKLEKINKPVEEKEPVNHSKAKFLCGKFVRGKPGRKKHFKKSGP